VRLVLALRALFFLVLVPGTVAGYLPYRILSGAGKWRRPELSVSSAAAMLLVLAGAAVLLACVWEFFARGRGTLAPVDPPRELVVGGLYRWTRNPMYNGVLTFLVGEAWLFSSPVLLGYGALFLATVHLFVVLYEEPDLAARFGDSYASYRRAVPRWGFTFRPYALRGTGEDS
jgi:protein-S-isoprenylcysteine O-methyltransferase Ste14